MFLYNFNIPGFFFTAIVRWVIVKYYQDHGQCVNENDLYDSKETQIYDVSEGDTVYAVWTNSKLYRATLIKISGKWLFNRGM